MAAKPRPHEADTLAEPHLPEEFRSVVEALIAKIGDDLNAIYWHGSFARGEAKPDSDHDLIIILKRAHDDVLLRLQQVFRGRENWSTFVQTEDELRQYPMHGRLQFAYGIKPLYGHIEPPKIRRKHVVDEIRSLARNIRFECRYRILHREQEYAEMESHYRNFVRFRNLRMLFYAAKLAVLALKARELLGSGRYPQTRAELRSALADPADLAIIDLLEEWPQPRESYTGDVTALALKLDACARKVLESVAGEP